ncbi:hypothetical protein BCR34DRAFT_72793 [Clohesyomyces aquaticus]|uniref:Uncharacterized protein n=1 Tax=Clohesyomyces aquaticus TaxID=1231657 RepID=A0A1Y1YZU4_9PLEO|nr:hypothetical protein BCR34DRAFT_72793 [Clohesyomyces aquaticus]
MGNPMMTPNSASMQAGMKTPGSTTNTLPGSSKDSHKPSTSQSMPDPTSHSVPPSSSAPVHQVSASNHGTQDIYALEPPCPYHSRLILPQAQRQSFNKGTYTGQSIEGHHEPASAEDPVPFYGSEGSWRSSSEDCTCKDLSERTIDILGRKAVVALDGLDGTQFEGSAKKNARRG